MDARSHFHLTATISSVGLGAGGDTSNPKLLVIAGPTASGKSAVALRLAAELQGEIVSSDSVQVYRELNIGSAKPTRNERSRIPHHLIDCCDPTTQFNTAQYLSLAQNAIDAAHSRGRRCVVVGGSTLYLTHLLHGLAKNPPPDPEMRAQLDLLSDEQLQERLSKLDAKSADRIHLRDRVRMIRAIESSTIKGRESSSIIAEHDYQQVNHPALIVVPVWQRDQLYRRIEMRTQRMLSAGLLEETRAIVERHGSSLRSLQSLGYKEAVSCIEGKLDPGDLEAEIAQNTRRYAKRQLTFWRNEPAKRRWITLPGSDDDSVVVDVDEKSVSRKLKPLVVRNVGYDRLLQLIKGDLAAGNNQITVWYVSSRVVEECEALSV